MNRTFMTLIEYWTFKPVQPTLGRWKLNDNIKRKIDLANIDNCGDNLCGIPVNKDFKKDIKIFDERWKKNYNSNNNLSLNSLIEDYNRRWKQNITVKDFKDNFT